MTRGNPKNEKGEAESAGAPAVSEQARKGRVPATAGAWLAPPPAAVRSRRGGRWRLTLEVLGLQKLRTTKLNTKGERRRASEWRAAGRQPPALPAPCRGAGGAASPRSRTRWPLGAPLHGGVPRLLLTPCSKCWLGSAGASPGRCRRGARSPRSPSRSAGSSCSL